MSRHLVTYHGGEMPTDPEAQQQVLQAFQTWAASVGSALLDPGAPLGQAKTISASGISEGMGGASISGYTLLEASSLDDAVRLLGTHPYVSRGGSLQVSEPRARRLRHARRSA